MYARAASRYRDVDLESAPKTQIVDRLFARFQRDCEDAQKAIAAKDIPAKAAAIDHATQIVVQLRAALDFDASPELCANLDGLYRYVIEQLGMANLKLSVFPLADAARVMATIGEGFRKAHETL